MSKKITHKNLKSLLSLGYLNSFFQNLFIGWYVAEELNREGGVSEVTMTSAFLSADWVNSGAISQNEVVESKFCWGI